MLNIRKAAATLGATALLATPIVALSATPAVAADRELRCHGAEVDFEVDKERKGNRAGFEVDIDVDDARPGSKWRIKLRHDGKLVHSKVYTADRDGEIDVNKWRKNTKGKDRFKAVVKPAGAKACTSVITRR
ncbi:hypothetical protein [Nocardioides gilvus]|uniref:hypothetical protein n=1 Tax=Nocardioides gilvus TaxID=1735589 RepID=UPI000D745D72|nr:hypothetical protein [Nocardioides gilvus]